MELVLWNHFFLIIIKVEIESQVSMGTWNTRPNRPKFRFTTETRKVTHSAMQINNSAHAHTHTIPHISDSVRFVFLQFIENNERIWTELVSPANLCYQEQGPDFRIATILSPFFYAWCVCDCAIVRSTMRMSVRFSILYMYFPMNW